MKTAALLAKRSLSALAGISVIALLGFPGTAPAQTPPAIDGNLEDMLQYAADLQAAEIGCPLVIEDPVMDVAVNDPSFIPCVPVVNNYYVNGFDHNTVVVVYDGSDLYLGMRVEGIIGDPDGNGDPDNNTCVASANIEDEPGVGFSASYRWFIDSDCDGIFEIMIEVNNGQVLVGGLAAGPASFDFNGSDIEVLVEDVNLIPLFRTRGFSGHLFDGLGEDLSVIVECPPLNPQILIQKSVDDVCPGLITTVNVQVENTGVVALDPVDIEDTLPPGFLYVNGSASNIPEGSQVGDVVTFPSIVLGPGEIRSFSFDIQAPEECDGPKTNLINVLGAFTHPCIDLPNNTLLILSEGSADFECTPTCVELAGENVETCVGSAIEVPLSVLNCSDFVEDFVIECTVGGQAQTPLVFNDVPSGQSINASIPVLCEVEGEVTVVCTVTASKDGELDCFSTDEGTFTVTCLEAGVEIAAVGTDNCIGDEFTIPVTVTNTSSGVETFLVNCSVGGVPQAPVELTGVPAGESREVMVPVFCEVPGEVEVTCTVEAYLERNRECTAEDAVTVTAICREAAVSVTAQSTQTCFGTEIVVPVTVTNESSEAADLAVSCMVGGVPQPLQEFPAVPAGESRMFNVTVLCGDEPVSAADRGDDGRNRIGTNSAGGGFAPLAEEIPVVCEATAVLVSNRECFANDAVEVTVTCREACVDIAMTDVETCVGSEIGVPVTVENCATEAANLVVTCLIKGQAQPPVVFENVEAGGTRDFNVNVLCEVEEEVTVECTVVTTLVLNQECTAERTASATVTCLEAGVEIAAVGTDNCIGDEFTIPVTVTNTSSGVETFLVNCSVGGVPQAPVELTGVPAGESREVMVPVFCEVPGEVEVTCTVEAYLERNRECTAEDAVTVTAICREAAVSVTAQSTQTCFGTEILVPVTVTNESSEAADLAVSCMVGGVPQPLQEFPAVPAGESRMFNVTVLCGDEPVSAADRGDDGRNRIGTNSAGGGFAPLAEEIPVVCEATAVLVSNRECFDNDAVEVTVTCREACVDIAMTDVETCVGSEIGVPVTVENCATEAANLVVTCLIKGQAQPPVVFENVEAGGTRDFNVNVLCEVEEEVTVECTVVTTLVLNQECTAERTASATVTCLEAGVEIAAEGTDNCIGDEFTIPVTVTNTSSGVETFLVNCTVGGVPQAPVELTGVPAGESREVQVPVFCEVPGEVEVTCTVEAYLERNQECTAEDAVTVTAICREAAVSIDAQSTETCVGTEIVVPVTVTNESLEAADLDVSCTVGGVPQAPQSFPAVPAGESRVVNLTVACAEPGEVAVACAVTATLVANENCTDEAEIAVTVTCREACVEIAAENTETCVGTTIEIPFLVENCATEPANLVVNCSAGGAPFDQVTFENVPAGETRTVNIPLVCEEVGEVEVSCSVVASLVSNPECTDEESSTIVVTCLEACVEIAAQDVEVCVGETAVVNVGVTNCSQGTENITVVCLVDGQEIEPMLISGLEAGDSTTVTVEVFCEEGGQIDVVCTATAELADNPDCTDEAVTQARITCLTPDVDIEKSTDPEVTRDDSKVSIVVRNTGTSVLNPVQVSDHLPAGLAFDTNQTIISDCNVSLDRVEEMNGALWVYFTAFTLAPGDSCTIMYDVGCIEFDNEARVDTAVVTAWCDGIDSDDPDNLIYAVSDTSTAEVTCQGGEACPHTIGFWRQQCAQKLNGSTKVCLEGMYTLWRRVIEETGVLSWKRNDGSMESTESLAELDNAALFQTLCDQLQGPRPMTHRDMAEIQYLGLMLNVTSGALPQSILLEGSAGFSGTVGEAIEAIENAINTGQNITHWKDVADAINNGQGVMADPCPGGNDLFRNIEPCGPGTSPSSIGIITEVRLRAYPNPVRGQSSVVRFAVPVHQDMSPVSVRVFDVSGRLVRTLVDENKATGEYTAAWDLRDQSGGQVAAGIYFYRLNVGDEQRTQRLLIIRSD